MPNPIETLQEADDDPSVKFAAIYARTSGFNQRNNFSIGGQIDQCWKHCQQRNWVVNYTFIDECIGGGTIDRPKFQLMLEKAKQKYFDVIVFWKLDRFCRSLVDLVNIERKLREWNVNLCSITEYIDTTTSVGRFNFRSLASVAEFEREIIGERSRMGLHALARMHKWPNQCPPFGYKKANDGKLVIDEVEAEIVREIFKEYIATRSMPQTAFNLNQRNTYSKSGKPWTISFVRKILTNELYVGLFSAAGFSDYVEEYRIIDDETYDRVVFTRNRFKRGRGKKPQIPRDRRLRTIDSVFKMYDDFLRETEMMEN